MFESLGKSHIFVVILKILATKVKRLLDALQGQRIYIPYNILIDQRNLKIFIHLV